ncbi:hypothetical protein GCM10028805_10480 [Spirosoma harenae]
MRHRQPNKYVNWITIWGFIFGCIAFNLYFDSRQDTQTYRTQYKTQSQRADSLYKETIRLEQRLREIEATSVKKLSTSQPSVARQVPTTNEL